MLLPDLPPEVPPFEARFESLHRRDRPLTRHQRDLEEREQSLSERLAALNLSEALLHARRRRLCAQLLAIAAIEQRLQT